MRIIGRSGRRRIARGAVPPTVDATAVPRVDVVARGKGERAQVRAPCRAGRAPRATPPPTGPSSHRRDRCRPRAHAARSAIGSIGRRPRGERTDGGVETEGLPRQLHGAGQHRRRPATRRPAPAPGAGRAGRPRRSLGHVAQGEQTRRVVAERGVEARVQEALFAPERVERRRRRRRYVDERAHRSSSFMVRPNGPIANVRCRSISVPSPVTKLVPLLNRRSKPGRGCGNRRRWPARASTATAASNCSDRTSRSTSPNERSSGAG